MLGHLLIPLVSLVAISAPQAPADRVVVASRQEGEPAPIQPQAAVDAQRRVYVTYGVGDEVRVARSGEDWKTFGEPSIVGSKGKLALGRRRGPRVAVAGESIVIAAIAGEQGGGKDGDVWAWRSTDGGTQWEAPRRVNSLAGSAREGLHALAGRPDGTLFCTWLDLRNQRTELWGTRSTDGGVTWEADRLLYRSPDGSICQCCHPSAAFGPDGTLAVMWRNDLDGARDMYLIRSSDGGKTFDRPTKLGEGTWPLDICPMDGGAVGVGAGGKIISAWMRDNAIYGTTPTRPELAYGPGVQAWVTFGPGGPWVVWLDRRGGALKSQGWGYRWGPIVIAAKASDPVVTSPIDGLSPVIAVWESTEDGSIQARVLSGHIR